MAEITLFYLEQCPYCRNAKKALQELTADNPAYGTVRITWVEESRQPAYADRFDYYYVPSLFLGEKKLYEAHPGESYAQCREQLRQALDQVLE